jgi:hypothetical protein
MMMMLKMFMPVNLTKKTEIKAGAELCQAQFK